MLERQTGCVGLATFSVPDSLSLFEFHDASSLLETGMRPSQVVIRYKAYTQGMSAALFAE